MDLWIPNNKNRLEKVLLGSVPTPNTLSRLIKKPIPKAIQRVLEETQEDLDIIKKKYESLGVEVLTFPVEQITDSIGTRNGFVVIDDHLYVTERMEYLNDFYDSVDKKTFISHDDTEDARYCPNIYIHDEYAILDGLSHGAYKYWKDTLSGKRQIITAFNEGHSDGIYCNVGDKIWLTNGDALDYKKYWPEMPVMELSKTNGGEVNDWEKVSFEKDKELHKTRGKWLIFKHELVDHEINFVEEYLENWIGYCDETLFDINMSIIDDKNVMAISQNSLVYEKLELLGVRVHQVPFRHRMFWDGGLHCITNDLVRKK